jgi:hypothetical protein
VHICITFWSWQAFEKNAEMHVVRCGSESVTLVLLWMYRLTTSCCRLYSSRALRDDWLSYARENELIAGSCVISIYGKAPNDAHLVAEQPCSPVEEATAGYSKDGKIHSAHRLTDSRLAL